MNKILILIVFGLIQFSCFSQIDYKIIHLSNDVELIKISENVYVHSSYTEMPKYGRFSSNGLIFINNKKAFLFDTPTTDSLTRELVSWITDTMKFEIAGFIPNHWHNDCIGGLKFLQSQKIESYANQKTIDICKAKNLPTPSHGFKDSLQLKLDDKLIQCYYFGAAHTVDNIVVWIPSELILFAGCMVKSLNSDNLGNIADGDILAYPQTLDKVLNKFLNAKIVIPGHGKFGGINLIKHSKELSFIKQK